MKKMDAYAPPLRWHARKMLKIMKLCIVLTLVCVFKVSASVYSQNTRFNMELQNVSIEKVFEEIKQQSNYTFFYDDKGISNIKNLSISTKNATAEKILDKCLAGTNYSYKIIDSTIVLFKTAKKEKKPKENIIKGKVTDEKGNPLPGVTIILDGTAAGTATNVKGEFNFTLPVKKGVLIFSFIGYKTKRINFEAGKPLNIKLIEEVANLDEVTVVAYGEVSKREMTGAVSVVKTEALKGIPSPSINNLLQGRVAGMDVTNISAAPGGGGTQITIRGYNSLDIENGRRFSNPLWVVDGVPMNTFTSPVTGTNALADINPETIESIQVLKDASATSLYGSRAANGVIIVTTKKGKKNQKAQFSVNFSHSYSILPAYPTIYGGKGERDYKLQALMNARTAYYDRSTKTYKYPTSYVDAWGKNHAMYDYFWGNGSIPTKESELDGRPIQDSLNNFYNNSTNFMKYYFQPGKVLNANIQTYGGSEKMTYSIGLGYYNEEGILKGSGYNRLNLMGNFNVVPVENLSIDLQTYLSVADRSRGTRNGVMSSGQAIETIPGNPFKLSTLLPASGKAVEKTLNSIKGAEEKNKTYRLRTNFGLKFTPIKGLEASTNLSLDYSQNNRNHFSPASMNYLNQSSTTGEIGKDYTVLNETLLKFKKSINENHNIDLMLGFSYQYDQTNYIGGIAHNGPSDLVKYATKKGWPNLEQKENGEWRAQKNYRSDFEEKKMSSIFGRINYNYKKRYMFTATLRRDGSSVFGENVRWATFPSAAFAWNFASEDFMRWADWLDFGKFRMSYGVSGNQFTNPYLSYGLLKGGYAYEGNPTVEPHWDKGFYNPDLTWEETSQYDFGLDMNMFNYKLSVSLDYYYRYTDQMLYPVYLPGNYSRYGQVWKNAAGVSNEGVELDVKYDIFRKENIRWTLSLNMAKNWNKFIESYNNRDIDNFIIGKELGGIYGYKTNGYIQNENEIEAYYNTSGYLKPFSNKNNVYNYYKPGDIRIVDTNGDKFISYDDRVYLGSSLPKVYGGIVNEIKYKNFDINMLLSYSIGRDIINSRPIISLSESTEMKPIFADLNNASFWKQEKDISDYPYNAYVSGNTVWTYEMDKYVEKVNYVKLKTLTVGYTLPQSWTNKVSVKSLRIFFSGENLYTLTNYSGLDPETVSISSGIDTGTNYPLARKFTFGLTIKL